MADFCLVARRTLDDREHQIFRFHFLLGADWKLCGRRLEMDRGMFFHSVYRIEEKLGRVFRELEPYPLFPLDDYFSGPSRFTEQACRPALLAVKEAKRPVHLEFPKVWDFPKAA